MAFAGETTQALETPTAPVWVLWLEDGGCDGCTMSVLGATNPRLEELLGGGMTRTQIRLVHPALALEAGRGYLAVLEQARAGALHPYLLVVEGAILREEAGGDGFFSSLGTRDGVPTPVARWVRDLAPGAEAIVAIGTCATSGGVPAAEGNVTGAMGLSQLLPGYQSRAGLPIMNLPGCAPSGDGFIEALSYVILHLEGLVPLDLDDQGRPRWLYSKSTPLTSQRRPDGTVKVHEGETADCPVPTRGWINRFGGCAALGGACNGCTRPDFPATLTVLASERA